MGGPYILVECCVNDKDNKEELNKGEVGPNIITENQKETIIHEVEERSNTCTGLRLIKKPANSHQNTFDKESNSASIKILTVVLLIVPSMLPLASSDLNKERS